MPAFDEELCEIVEYIKLHGDHDNSILKTDLQEKFGVSLQNRITRLKHERAILDGFGRVRLLPPAFDIMRRSKHENTSQAWWKKYSLEILVGVAITVIGGIILSFLLGNNATTNTVTNSDGVVLINGDENAVNLNIVTNLSILEDREKKIFPIKTHYETTLESLRTSKNLRQLAVFESDREISKTPVSTFFFIYAYSLQSKFNGSLNSMAYVSVSRQQKFGQYEIHYLSEEDIQLIGFLSADAASRVTQLQGSDEESVILFSEPYKEFNILTSIPLEHLKEARERDSTDDEGRFITFLDLKLR